jgi:glycosyltransferase involved in cell wall biosynthesis
MRHRASSELSILVPVYNEVDSLPQLYDEICRACAAPVVSSFEIIFVNDGSTDGSTEAMNALADQDPRVIAIHLRRNFGKSPALAAGFQRARGEIIITMDADLQDDPAMIPEFVRMIREGADLVSGWKQRRHDPLDKTFPSRIFNYVVRASSGVKLHDFNCGFKAYRAECAGELRVYGGFHRFLPVFAHDRGFRVEELVVQHRPRVHGHSKFGKKRLVEGLLDLPTVLLLTRYRTRPLHFFGVPGALISAVGFAILSYLTVLRLLGEAIGTRPLLMLGVLLVITGVQILCVGLVAELIVRSSMGRGEVFAIREVRSIERADDEREQRAELTHQ